MYGVLSVQKTKKTDYKAGWYQIGRRVEYCKEREEKMKYHITTPYGNVYECTEKGRVTRYNEYRLDGRQQHWRFLGAIKVNAFKLRGIISLQDLFCVKNLLYKNGHPRYTIVDEDNGTLRVWGNTKVHGIKFIDVI